MELSLNELAVIRDGLGKVALSNDVISALKKIDAEIDRRGYRRELKPLPKQKYKKQDYEYVYVKK